MTGLRYKFSALACAVLLVCFGAAADSALNNIDINVALNPDGSADFTEIWTFTLEPGNKPTELFFSHTWKQPVSLARFGVSENGISFKQLEPWRLDASAEEKTHRYGINVSGDQHELCWGIGAPGTHRYTVSYTLNNLVRAFDDRRALLYYTFFIVGNIPPEDIVIRISRAGEPFSPDDVISKQASSIANLTFDNGVFEITPDRELDEGDHLTLRAEFDREAFGTLVDTGINTAISPEEMASPMMNQKEQVDAAGSWWDRILNFYDKWPNVTLLLLIGGLYGLFYLIKKIWIALI